MTSIDDICDDTFPDKLVVIAVKYLLLWDATSSVDYIDRCFTKKLSLSSVSDVFENIFWWIFGS